MNEKSGQAIDPGVLLELTTQIVSAYVAKAKLSAADLTETIGSVSRALIGLAGPQPEPPKAELIPAVAVKKSVMPDYIVCLEDGKKLKMLKRHLMSTYGMTPEEYRAKWQLPRDYPMVAPNYAKVRSELAKKIGLGRIATPVEEPPPPPAPAPKKTAGRRKVATAAAE
jgi:predicted transcriptional regulator